jgi:hypothetical protein
MRLLTHDEHGNIALETFEDVDPPPPYAILSHTWLPDNRKEVSLQDLQAGRADDKAGYNKIRFCAQQAAADGLKYFWIDTCCIDQSSSAELTEAINSMFRWYQRAAKCYVYLSDVVVPDEVVDVPSYRIAWEDAFRRSRWFTRGWTMQELLAPASVEFFSKEGKHLGSKISLEQEICEITKIPVGAIRGQHLSEFSINERMNWAARRSTTRKEDKAYCLLGIFGVFMPLIYGEGEDHALKRLKKKTLKSLRQHNNRGIRDPAKLTSK